MARKRPLLLAPLPAVLKYFLLGISIILFILLSQGEAQLTKDYPLSLAAQAANLEETDQQHQAQTLTKMGHEQLSQGQAREALQTWQEANRIYRKLHHEEGITGSLVNQSLALQDLGQYYRACSTLLESLYLKDWVCQNPSQMDDLPDEPEKLLIKDIQARPDLNVRVLALRSFGDVLRLIGKLDESEIVLQQTLAMAKRLAPDAGTDDILLSLGNTEQALYSRARDRLRTAADTTSRSTEQQLVQDRFRTAVNLYQQVANSATKQKGIALQAQLNHLSLLLDLGRTKPSEAGWKFPVLETLQSEMRPQIQPLLDQLLTAQFSQIPAVKSIYARLNFADSLIDISQAIELKQLISQEQINPLNIALRYAQDSIEVAIKLESIRAGSYAYGTIGKIYLLSKQHKTPQQYFEKALRLAQSIQAWDIAYQWQYQLGLLYQEQAKLGKAAQAFEAAINSLEQVRGNILSINPEVQLSFMDKVAPVYRDYTRLLLSSSSPNIQKAIQVNEQLQIAELENFLRCGKLDLVSLTQVEKAQTAPTVIHVLSLGDQIEVIIQSPDKGLFRYSPDTAQVANNTDYLLLNLQEQGLSGTAKEQTIQSYSQPLYNLLIAPAKEKGYLPSEGTLLFVMDSSLQSLPVAVMHDGQKYLFENYSIAMALGSQLREPKAMPPGQRALIAGLSKVSPTFEAPKAPKGLLPLPEVETEVEDIKKNLSSTVELLNDKFTSERFQQEFTESDFPIVHISTHGQFSSDPQRTVLLAWDKLIDVQQFASLVRSKTQGSQDSIELLVLSACETATGDPRSGLGIAGLAAQAGARSTVASLWLVDAASTTELMREFYKNLHNGTSKAEALRQAQLVLFKNPKYHHPYFWAGFILVGSWL